MTSSDALCVSVRNLLTFVKGNMSLPAAMDLSKIRKTEDGKVSVVDVIVQIKKCTANYAAQVYTRQVRTAQHCMQNA